MGRKLTDHSSIPNRGSLALLVSEFQYEAVAELRSPDARWRSFDGQTLGGGVLDKLPRFPHVGPSSSVHCKRFRRRRLFRQQARILHG
jgi:hypothetical protein